MSITWRTTNAQIATPEMRWNAQPSIPSRPRYRSSIEPPLSSRTAPRSGDGCDGAGRRHGQLLDDRVCKLARARRPAEVVRDGSALGDDRSNRVLDPLGGRLLAEVPEHEDAAQEQRGGIRLVLAGVLRR